MRTKSAFELGRRRFLAGVLPVCSALCLGARNLLAFPGSGSRSAILQDVHMFDREYPRKMTFRQFVEAQNFSLIRLAKAAQKRFGKGETLELLKEIATEFNLERGNQQAKNSPDRSLKSYTRIFANPKSWEGILDMEVVEDTDKAFEIKVKECLQAAHFLKHDASDIGFAYVCWGDYAWAEGFNPKIKLVRDKTLMQGHDCCNHRYIISE